MTLPTYKIYKIQWHLAMQDPFMPQAIRYHTNIFIETSQDGSGTIYEVNGDIVSASGMSYLKFPSPPPESFESFYQRNLLGKIAVSDLEEVTGVLKSIPPPPRQRWFNPKSMKMEACKVDGTPYRYEEVVPKFWKCTEWTNEKAIPALWAKGLIKMVNNEDVVGN
ncbi:uncharacterized protein EAF02_006632 [Botrytis sinoallii]|uniref:uncharacterized protein n=1 Tax=Botrytis sinoallii TaxID=1463999 RepID=UPI0018FFB629|nr:uncharacterized protein EAF02_006632 [Botrytis sinoallii]KAF7881944.1 hypothetical protein EAF02_006632 [Botrytis sinoallii]